MFQLIQRNLVLSKSPTVGGLAFCRLDCHTNWEVWLAFPLPMSSQALVSVDWAPAGGYRAVRWLEGTGHAVLNKQLSHSTIIPTVQRLLTEAAAAGRFDTYHQANKWFAWITPTGDAM